MDGYDVTSKSELCAIISNLQFFLFVEVNENGEANYKRLPRMEDLCLVSARVVVKAVEFVAMH